MWLAFLMGELLTMSVVCGLVWKRAGKVILSAEAFAMLPRLFGVKDRDRMEMTVRTLAEAEEASERAEAFCRAHGESERKSKLISLCVEEMVSNIVSHGFKKVRNEHSVDLRILFKGVGEAKTYAAARARNYFAFLGPWRRVMATLWQDARLSKALVSMGTPPATEPEREVPWSAFSPVPDIGGDPS